MGDALLYALCALFLLWGSVRLFRLTLSEDELWLESHGIDPRPDRYRTEVEEAVANHDRGR